MNFGFHGEWTILVALLLLMVGLLIGMLAFGSCGAHFSEAWHTVPAECISVKLL